MSLSITIRAEGLAGVDKALSRLNPLDSANLMQGLARLIQQQTRRRIEEEKVSPDGKAWPPNRTGTSTLYRQGHLSRSIDYAAGATHLEVGSGLIYAAIHQYGGTIVPKSKKVLSWRAGNQQVFARKVTIPARPYIGVSAANGKEILEETAAYVRRKLG